MAAASGSVWAIDIGSNAIKAIKLTDENGFVEVVDFDVIRHGKILTGKGVELLEREELIAITLRKFTESHDILVNDEIIISLPSQNSFARFVNIPPVEPKKIPEIVRFEAVQQIPFDINDVQWDYQMMEPDDSGENRVGLFAIKNEVIDEMLEHFTREAIQVKYIQMAPIALYNYAIYDRADIQNADENAAIVILNMGAEYTDLVICSKNNVWQRCIPMGGNSFTKAISDAFRINFEKAERLKKNATSSKYAREILKAMRSVFADFASEVQRSIGFYKGSNADTNILKLVAMGGGTRMRGLVKYLQQSLQMPIERTDSFEKLKLSPKISVAKFNESVCDLGIVYGLGLQALEQAKINSNLLPANIARSMMWQQKAKYFLTAACLLLLVSVLAFGRVMLDKTIYRSNDKPRKATKIILDDAGSAQAKLQEQLDREPLSEKIIQDQKKYFQDNRDVITELVETILDTMPNEKNNPDQEDLYLAFKRASEEDIKEIKKTPRALRKQIFITNMSVKFTDNLKDTGFTDQVTAGSTVSRAGSERMSRAMETATRIDAAKRSRNTSNDSVGETRGGATLTANAETTVVTPQNEIVKETSGPGFVVTITGYTPYKDVPSLFDPAESQHGGDEKKWGILTRLKNLDPNGPFEIYNPNTSKEHFDWPISPVEINQANMPPLGVGVLSSRKIKVDADAYNNPANTMGGRPGGGRPGGGRPSALTQTNTTIDTGPLEIDQPILIDPMTKEIISIVEELDDQGFRVEENGQYVEKENDYWFTLRVKFLWKNAPYGQEL